MNGPQIFFEYVGPKPHGRQVSNFDKFTFSIDVLGQDSISVDHGSIKRRSQWVVCNQFSLGDRVHCRYILGRKTQYEQL